MLYFTKSKGDCTGCSACMSCCPVQCISMQPDEEGFLYPVASDACVHCGKCETVCPCAQIEEHKEIVGFYQQQAYCALTKDKIVWQRSTSGGAFSEICKAYGDCETIICGAVWDEFKVHHVCVKGVHNIAPLCKSKYVASSQDDVFSEIKHALEEENKVIYCGTPCQIAGLKSYLSKEYEKLLLIDLICHGVGSPKVFDTCINILDSKLSGNVSSYEFRAKRKVYQTDHIQLIKMTNGKAVYVKDDPYIQLFLSQQCLRPSCGENCRYRTEQRQGDITIADFKGLLEVFPKLTGTKKNYSSVIVNSVKGQNVLAHLTESMEVNKCSIEDIKRYNPLFYRHTWHSDQRNAFFEEFIIAPEQAIKKRCTSMQIYENNWKRKIWEHLPVKIRKVIIELRRSYRKR